jgi:hypothetical protein
LRLELKNKNGSLSAAHPIRLLDVLHHSRNGEAEVLVGIELRVFSEPSRAPVASDPVGRESVGSTDRMDGLAGPCLDW